MKYLCSVSTIQCICTILQVNSWKTGLSSGELRTIETKCGDTLSKMEYQLLGAA